MRWTTVPVIALGALLLMMPPGSLFAFQEEKVEILSLEGEDVPLALCVQAFLDTEVRLGTREEKRLRDDSFADEGEWNAIVDARLEFQKLYPGITTEFHKQLDQEVEPLKEADYDAYLAAEEAATQRWWKLRMETLARIYSGLLDKLDTTSEAALEEYVQPGVCADHAVSLNTTEGEFDPMTIAAYQEFERLLEEYRR